MNLFEVGRLAMKIAGRDAGKKCVVVDNLEEGIVLIDGQTRRRKCNIKHLEPLHQVIKIKKGVSHSEVASEFKKLGLEVLDTKPKERKERPRRQRKEKLHARKEEVKKQREEEEAKVKEAAEKEAVKEKVSEDSKPEEKKSDFENKVEE